MGLDAEVTNDAEGAGRDENTKYFPLLLDPLGDLPTELQSVGLIELLETDERLVLIFDLTSPTKLVPIYSNPRLKELQRHRIPLGTIRGSETVEVTFRNNEYAEFAAWATSASTNGALPVTTYYGMEWAGRTLRARWGVVSGPTLSSLTDEEAQQRNQSVAYSRALGTKATGTVA
jgi:hypothetical protein